MSKPEVTVTVSGKPGISKTTLAFLLQELLEGLDVEVNNKDPDGQPIIEHCKQFRDERLKVLRGVKVTIKHNTTRN